MGRQSDYSLADKGALIMDIDFKGPKYMAQVCRERGVPYDTARKWLAKRDELGFPQSDTIKLVKEKFAERKGQIVDDLLEIVDLSAKQVKKRIGDSNARDAASVMGIAIDKLNLIRETEVEEPDKKFEYMPEDDQVELVERVLSRLKENQIKDNAVDVEYDVVE